MKNYYFVVICTLLLLNGCAVKTTPGMTLTQLNSATVLTGNGNLVLVQRIGEFEIYQSSAVLDWKRQISQGNLLAKSILTPELNVYYVLKNGMLQKEIVGDESVNSFIGNAQPVARLAQAAPQPKANEVQPQTTQPNARATQTAPQPKAIGAKAQPPKSAAPVQLIDTKNKATLLGSCAGIAHALPMATTTISIALGSRTTQNQDEAWKLQKDIDSMHRLGRTGELYTNIDYNSVPPSQINDINIALTNTQDKAINLSSTLDGSWQVVNAFNKCRGR